MMLPTLKKSQISVAPTVDWLGLHREYLGPGEMDVIVGLINGINASSMIEFGCRDGRTACVLLHNVPTLTSYVGVDVPPSYEPSLAHQRREMISNPGYYALDDPRFELVIRERGSLDLGPQDLEICDAAFIDGDHSERVVTHDSNLARALVKPGGIIIWHDAYNSVVDVNRVLNKLFNEGWPIELIEGTWLAVMRV